MYEQLHLDLHRMRSAELARDAELRHLAAAHAAAARTDDAGRATRRRPRLARRARRTGRHPWGLPSGASHAWFA